jgi:hypothetical protein
VNRRLSLWGRHLSPAEPAQTLRQVSILFLVVVGSTSLARRLDPEAISPADLSRTGRPGQEAFGLFNQTIARS